MSSAASKLFSLRSAGGRIFLFFLLFWLLAVTLISLYTLALNRSTRQARLLQVEERLQNYLARNQPVSTTPFSLEGELPRELDFIRLVREQDQLLITGNSHMDFSGLVDLDPLESGAWLDLHHPEKEGDWLLVSRPLKGGGIVQAGKNDRGQGRVLQGQITTIAGRIMLLSGPLGLLLALFTVSLMRRPLRKLEAGIETALQQKDFHLPHDLKGDPDLRAIHRLLEQIFYQNRQLIREMQSSLDNVAHDLRTPMTRLRAGAEYALQSNSSDPEIYRNALSDNLEESERVLTLLGVMMSVAEAEAGTMRLEMEEIDVLESLEDVVSLYQYVAEEEQISVRCAGESGLLIEGDRARISQVWANLLDNGIKYGHESGEVTITARRHNGEAVICFRDNGMGISESEITRIWDRLYRGDRSRTRQGLGLGLNYVKAVVEAHGGQVSVTSTIGEGSCFDVYLPLRG